MVGRRIVRLLSLSTDPVALLPACEPPNGYYCDENAEEKT